MPQAPSVTWIMPVLNGMPFLPAALDSIRSQTCQDYEVLVWDNGSTDGTLEVLREWIPHRLPGRVITGQPLSLGLSLRRLVEETQTELCARMDADDINMPHRLETELAFLAKHPDISLVGSCTRSIDEHSQPLSKVFYQPEDWIEIRHATLNAPRIPHPTVLFRRAAVLAAGNYADDSTPANPYWCEDYDLWLRLMTKHRAHTLQEKLIEYRVNPVGLSCSEQKLGRSRDGRLRAWVKNAEAFAGISSKDTASRLFERKLSLALPELLKIARHMQTADGLTPAKRWRSLSFLSAVSKFVNPADYITRAFVSWHWSRARRASAPSQMTAWEQYLLNPA